MEGVQKKALAVILGKDYNSYESALSQLNLERLDTRRENLCHSFALKSAKSARHQEMFPLNPNFRQNMRNRKPYMEHTCNTSRYFNSPIPHLTRLLNRRS